MMQDEEVYIERRFHLVSVGLQIWIALVGFAGVIFSLLITVAYGSMMHMDMGFGKILQCIGIILLLNLVPLMMVIGPFLIWVERRSAILVNRVLMILFCGGTLAGICYDGWGWGWLIPVGIFVPYLVMIFLISHKRWVSIL